MECTFCGRSIPEGTEVIFVTRKGRALYFCRSKCEKNMIKLGRIPRKVKWTKEYAREKEARMKLAAPAKQHAQESKPAKEEASAQKEKKPKADKKEIKPKPKKKAK